MYCFACDRNVTGGNNPLNLLRHLRYRHGIGAYTSYFRCGQNGCQRTFHKLFSFRRHLYLHYGHEQGNMVEVGENGLNPEDMENDMAAEDNEDVAGMENLPMQGDYGADTFHIKEEMGSFLCGLSASKHATLTSVQLAVSNLSPIFKNMVSVLRNKTERVIQEVGMDQEHPAIAELMETFEEMSNPFEGLETEAQRKSFLKTTGYFIEPEVIALGTSYTQKVDKATGEVRQVQGLDTSQYISIKKVMEVLLHMPGVMEQILSYRQMARDDDILTDFQDGEYYKRIVAMNGTDLIIPIVFYYDDMEVANPLGSKAGVHKQGAFYYNLKCLPPHISSSLRNIFLIMLCKSDDIKTYGFPTVCDKVITDLKDMETTGVLVDTNTFKGPVRVIVGQVTGDNLGIHGLFGLVESFVANYPCRRCKVFREDLRIQTVENGALLRTRESYEEDLQGNVADTGIKSASCFNDLQYFHIIGNSVFDIMHDILEGVGMIEFKLILNALILNGHVDLNTVNARITSFDYGFADQRNKPSLIKDKFHRNVDQATGQNALQAWCLLRYFPLMIGDLIPEDDQYFELLLMLLDCMLIIFSPSVSKGATYYLKHLITDHHEHFLHLFPDVSLKPKHHFMLHYPRAIREIGPLQRFWTARFEGKHNFFKTLARNICNFRNLSKSLAIRHQWNFCQSAITGQLLKSHNEVTSGILCKPRFLDDCTEEMMEAINLAGIPLDEEVYVANSVVINGTLYRPGMTLLLAWSEDTELPVFCKIKYIVVLGDSDVRFCSQTMETEHFNRHLFSYAAQLVPTSVVTKPEDLLDYHPLHATKAYTDDGYLYIAPRYRIF